MRENLSMLTSNYNVIHYRNESDSSHQEAIGSCNTNNSFPIRILRFIRKKIPVLPMRIDYAQLNEADAESDDEEEGELHFHPMQTSNNSQSKRKRTNKYFILESVDILRTGSEKVVRIVSKGCTSFVAIFQQKAKTKRNYRTNY
jgi:hypothetical protein